MHRITLALIAVPLLVSAAQGQYLPRQQQNRDPFRLGMPSEGYRQPSRDPYNPYPPGVGNRDSKDRERGSGVGYIPIPSGSIRGGSPTPAPESPRHLPYSDVKPGSYKPPVSPSLARTGSSTASSVSKSRGFLGAIGAGIVALFGAIGRSLFGGREKS